MEDLGQLHGERSLFQSYYCTSDRRLVRWCIVVALAVWIDGHIPRAILWGTKEGTKEAKPARE